MSGSACAGKIDIFSMQWNVFPREIPKLENHGFTTVRGVAISVHLTSVHSPPTFSVYLNLDDRTAVTAD